MKKLKLNCPLHHKAYSHDTVQVEVEKVITLYGSRFQQMRDHPLEDCPEIAQHNDLMYMADGVAHCLLFVDSKTGDGLLVEAEGYDYARNSHFVPNAKAILENNEITNEERQLHRSIMAMADRAAELAHKGEEDFQLSDLLMHTETDVNALLLTAVAVVLRERQDIERANFSVLNIPCQPDLRVKAKSTREMKFFSPLHIVHEPDAAAYSWDEPISEMDYEELNDAEMLACKDEINRFIEEFAEPEEENRGLMVYFNGTASIDEKVVSAFPMVEEKDGVLMGVLCCRIAADLTEEELEEFCSWWEGQAADGVGESLEQRVIETAEFGGILVHFWDDSDDWRIQTEMQESSPDTGFEEEEVLEMNDMSMGGMV